MKNYRITSYTVCYTKLLRKSRIDSGSAGSPAGRADARSRAHSRARSTSNSVSGRGTVVTGRVERGIIPVGDDVEIVGIRPTLKTVCTGVEMFRKLLDEGRAGDNIGVLLRGTKLV